MIELKRLEASEYELLLKVDDGYCPEPSKSIAVIAQNDHGIIGRIFLLTPAHVEGVFLQEAWRNGPVLKMLVNAIELEARAEGITTLLAYAKDKTMEDYNERLGYERLPLSVWAKDLTKCL